MRKTLQCHGVIMAIHGAVLLAWKDTMSIYCVYFLCVYFNMRYKSDNLSPVQAQLRWRYISSIHRQYGSSFIIFFHDYRATHIKELHRIALCGPLKGRNQWNRYRYTSSLTFCWIWQYSVHKYKKETFSFRYLPVDHLLCLRQPGVSNAGLDDLVLLIQLKSQSLETDNRQHNRHSCQLFFTDFTSWISRVRLPW